jgi:hypothetical protein
MISSFAQNGNFYELVTKALFTKILSTTLD